MTLKLVKNQNFNSVELYFSEKPSEALRTAMKAHKYRYNPKKNCWYTLDSVEKVQKLVKEYAKKSVKEPTLSGQPLPSAKPSVAKTAKKSEPAKTTKPRTVKDPVDKALDELAKIEKLLRQKQEIAEKLNKQIESMTKTLTKVAG